VVHHRDRRNRRRRGGRGRVRRNLTGPHRVDVNPGRAAGGKVVVVLARHGTGHEAAGRIGDVVTATARTRTGARDEGRRRVHHQHRTAITVDVVLQGDVTRGSHVTADVLVPLAEHHHVDPFQRVGLDVTDGGVRDHQFETVLVGGADQGTTNGVLAGVMSLVLV